MRFDAGWVRKVVWAGLGSLGSLLCGVGTVAANGPEVGFDAGTVFPLQSQNIRLVEEFVDVFVGDQGKATCQYTLRNLSQQPQRISMAFVANSAMDPIPSAAPYRTAGIRVERLVDGERRVLPVHTERLDGDRWEGVFASPPDSLPVWEVVFRPLETVLLKISYQTSWSGGCDGSNCGFTMSYHARAARFWAGPIEYASIRFAFGSVAGLLMECAPDWAKCLTVTASPPGYAQRSSGVAWEFRDWEPDQDFSVSVDWVDPD